MAEEESLELEENEPPKSKQKLIIFGVIGLVLMSFDLGLIPYRMCSSLFHFPCHQPKPTEYFGQQI